MRPAEAKCAHTYSDKIITGVGMGDGNSTVAAVQRALEALHANVGKLSQEYGDTLGVGM